MVAQSVITQALLCEPGVSQKAFALMSYWCLNEMGMDRELMARTISSIVRRHEARGVTSDVSWALAFCLEHDIELDEVAGEVLTTCDDDCIALQALHCHARGLIPRGFSDRVIRRLLVDADLDDAHWLLGYEALRQGFLTESQTAVTSNAMFGDLLEQRVAFYRTDLPSYAVIIHPGGAPWWFVERWLHLAGGGDPRPGELEAAEQQPAYIAVRDRMRELVEEGISRSPADTMAALVAGAFEQEAVGEDEEYSTAGVDLR